LCIAGAVAAAPTEIPAFLELAADADIVVLGEVHDNPRHHAIQAEIVRAMAPAALVFEMIPQALETEVGRMLSEGAGMSQIADVLDWESSGWPDFGFYFEILQAAPYARVFGAGQSQEDTDEAMNEGAAEAFGRHASTYGLDVALSEAVQAEREAEMQVSHCDALPAEMLPGMVEVQRFRDAGLADAALWARTITGAKGQVVVITGTGHADLVNGTPSLIARAAPDVRVISLGQLEAEPDGAAPAFDAYTVAPPPPGREDPCLAFGGTEG